MTVLSRPLAAALLASLAASAPCDIFGSGGTPCVAAHSVVRALYAAYDGPLYSVNRTRNGALMDVRTLAAGGYADAAAQDAFCASLAPAPPPALPALGSVVSLTPAGLPGYSFRHCDAQGFVTPNEAGNADHLFTLVAALSGAPFPAAVSFRSVNFPAWYLSRVTGAELGRLGIAQAPAAADASWAVAAAAGGAGLTLALAGGAGFAAVGGNCTGSCARNYLPPAASVLLAAQPDAWLIAAPPGPPACTIAAIYDQSPRGNHLFVGPAGGNGRADRPVDAARLRLSAGGHAVYAAYFEGGGQGYRVDNTSGVATGNDPETLYMVTSGKHFNAGCCFDYGNAETNNNDDGAGTMEAVYFGSWNAEHDGGWCGGAGDNGTAQAGPWGLADLENGLWACGTPKSINPAVFPLKFDFAVAMVKGGTDGFALKASDATRGPLIKTYEGPRPPGYQPMKKQGAIILGIGGDDSSSAEGVFFEGVMTHGYSSDAVDDLVQADIVAAKYGQ